MVGIQAGEAKPRAQWVAQQWYSRQAQRYMWTIWRNQRQHGVVRTKAEAETFIHRRMRGGDRTRIQYALK